MGLPILCDGSFKGTVMSSSNVLYICLFYQGKRDAVLSRQNVPVLYIHTYLVTCFLCSGKVHSNTYSFLNMTAITFPGYFNHIGWEWYNSVMFRVGGIRTILANYMPNNQAIRLSDVKISSGVLLPNMPDNIKNGHDNWQKMRYVETAPRVNEKKWKKAGPKFLADCVYKLLYSSQCDIIIRFTWIIKDRR